jgi:hypothetical protein
LCEEAMTLSKEAVLLAKSDKERGEMLYLGSWARFLSLMIRQISYHEPIKDEWRRVVLDSQEATKLCPDNSEIRRGEMDLYENIQFYCNSFKIPKELEGIEWSTEKKKETYDWLFSEKKRSPNDMYRLHWLSWDFISAFPNESRAWYDAARFRFMAIRTRNSYNRSSVRAQIQWLLHLKETVADAAIQKSVDRELSLCYEEIKGQTLNFFPLTTTIEVPAIYMQMVPFVREIRLYDRFSPNIVPRWEGLTQVRSNNTTETKKPNDDIIQMFAVRVETQSRSSVLSSRMPPQSFQVILATEDGEYLTQQSRFWSEAYAAWKKKNQYTYFTSRPW